MKRIIALGLSMTMSISLIFTGCDFKKQKPEQPTEPEIVVKWSDPKEFKNIDVPYLPIPYEANVMPYTINKDLSNIENIDMFSGFSSEQMKLLSNNGFIVLSGKDTKIFETYNRNFNQNVPSFITSDSVLHIYQQFYNKSLKYIEDEYLADDLSQLTESMFTKSIKVKSMITDAGLTDLANKNASYFLVAKMLLAGNSYTSSDLDKNMVDLAKKEYQLIQKAKGVSQSPLFGIQVDYSQFKVRGHYTQGSDSQRFFQTMMWYGLTSLPLLVNEGKGLNIENAQKALIMTYTMFVDGDQDNTAKLWNDIYEPTCYYVGVSDDLNVFDLQTVLINVLGEKPDLNLIAAKENYGPFFEEIIKLRNSKINVKHVSGENSKDKPFRFMGQRYVLDNGILQALSDPELRPIPSGLDIMAVLGSAQAELLINTDLRPQEKWPKYQEIFKGLNNEFKAYDNGLWQSNLYNGWLWVIKSSIKEFNAESKMPFFMTNEAWRQKSLNTGLSSYAEMKHDTVLYGEQVIQDTGGPVDTAQQHYVEPNIELYSKLLWLMQNATTNLKARGLLNDTLLKGADDYIATLQLLINCSIRELNNAPLTENEKEQLLTYGNMLQGIQYAFNDPSTNDQENNQDNKSAMVVSDVMTIDHKSLTVGTGFFDEIYVVVPIEGKLYLSRGSVYSYYEFMSDNRLKDEEWWALNGLKTSEDNNVFEITEPSPELPFQPIWTQSFKSETNKIEIEE